MNTIQLNLERLLEYYDTIIRDTNISSPEIPNGVEPYSYVKEYYDIDIYTPNIRDIVILEESSLRTIVFNFYDRDTVIAYKDKSVLDSTEYKEKLKTTYTLEKVASIHYSNFAKQFWTLDDYSMRTLAKKNPSRFTVSEYNGDLENKNILRTLKLEFTENDNCLCRVTDVNKDDVNYRFLILEI